MITYFRPGMAVRFYRPLPCSGSAGGQRAKQIKSKLLYGVTCISPRPRTETGTGQSPLPFHHQRTLLGFSTDKTI